MGWSWRKGHWVGPWPALASPAVLNLSAPCCPLVVTAASIKAEQGRPGCPGIGLISEPGGVTEGTRFVFSPTLGP